ncbi:MAG: hypothetical protein ABS87_00820 [Sphingomonas sp. SCN 67-18]|uniref:hypothetical protein n=1 Tax=uncultured Sphingomonas sp. TaxID=158754 RepID=UPI00086A0DC6|nr:hypothetical protein [Sphingomonas sp. SCN 67-18]ODU22742.1 MAG: hypothetical protein ABS87_00820 [Sphingomonas sp. SCN 67-18]
MDIDAQRARALNALIAATRRDERAMRLQHWLMQLAGLLGHARDTLDRHGLNSGPLRRAIADAAREALALEQGLRRDRARLKRRMAVLTRASAGDADGIVRSVMDEDSGLPPHSQAAEIGMVNKISGMDQRGADLPPK